MEWLVDAGLVRRVETASGLGFVSAVSTVDPFESLVAVELKLRNWKTAIAQAGKYRLFADVSYIAMPVERLGSAVLVEAARQGVGVLGVHAGRSADVWGAEATVVEVLLEGRWVPALQPHRRRWASEEVLAAYRQPSGRSAGDPIC